MAAFGQTIKTPLDIRFRTKESRSQQVSESSTRKRKNSGRATLQDVADRVGVTSITVSRFFQQPSRVSAEMRERIAAAVAELGYVPNLVAGNLASAKSHVVG